MAEKFQAKTLEQSSQNSKDKQESIGYNESKKELQIKEAYYQVIKELKTSMKDDVDNLQKIVKSLRERESTFSNFVSPENFLGLSTLIRSDNKTFSGDRLDEIESMLEKMKLRQIGMIKLERMIENGIKLVDIKKDSNVKLFLESPEGVFLNGIIFDQTNPQILEGEGIKKPSELITYAENIAAKYRGGPDEKMSEALRSTVDSKNLEMFKEEFGIILDKWKKFRPENIQQELPDFEIFKSRVTEKKIRVTEIYTQLRQGKVSEKEKLDFLIELDNMKEDVNDQIQKLGKDNLSFCYFYELFKLNNSFVNETIRKINITNKL